MWYVLLLLLCYAFKQNLHAVSHHHTIVDTDKIRPPKRRSRVGAADCGAGPRASERTTVAAHARPDPYLRRRRPPSQTPISRRTSVLRTRARADHAPRDQRQRSTAQQHSTHAARASKPRRAQSGRAHRRPRHRGSPPGAENAEKGDGSAYVILAVGRNVARGPRSTFLSRRTVRCPCIGCMRRAHATNTPLRTPRTRDRRNAYM